MPSGRTAPQIQLTQRQRNLLETICRRATARQSLVTRAHIILLASRALPNYEIAAELALQDDTVATWRNRYVSAQERLLSAEAAQDSDEQLEFLIQSVLSDLPRPGGPSKFTAEQLTQIIAVALEDPKDSGRPVSHWNPRELIDEVQKRGIVSSISLRHMERFFKSGRLEARSLRLLAHPEHHR